MSEWFEPLIELSDEPSEFAGGGSEAIFARHGQEYAIHVRSIPGAGVCLDRVNDKQLEDTPLPVWRFVQEELLKLPRLSRQIQRALEVSRKLRPSAFVDGPALATIGNSTIEWSEARPELRRVIAEFEPGSTRLIQLMARAGQGKTVLLEEIALASAQAYRPEQAPSPLVLVVDLLGRYVGSIDDAIAGALNNTYLSPGMSQRDVVYCMRQNWLALALDGFDELAARIGSRDAFLRISDLVDQLGASGTVLLSARESFFELHRISASIRTYLQPKVGAYATATVQLRSWTEKQGVQVFRSLQSSEPERAMNELLQAFKNDRDLVLQPFFLTRLAQLWMEGERFDDAKAVPSELGRIRYVIVAFIGREVQKWKDRERNEILSTAQHIDLLASIAEEMWRSGAFKLTKEELQVVAEMALENWKLTPEKRAEVMSRVSTHGAFIAKEQRISFLHDRFFDYFFAVRVSRCMLDGDIALAPILKARQINRAVVEWIGWMVRESAQSVDDIIRRTLTLRKQDTSDALEENVVLLSSRLAANAGNAREVLFENLTFIGEPLRGENYRSLTFQNCSFWQLDLRGTTLADCSFQGCKFGDMLIDARTDFGKSKLDQHCEVISVEVEYERSYFAPDEIAERLSKANAAWERRQPVTSAAQTLRLDRRLLFAVERFVRASERTTDVAMEDMEEQFGDEAAAVAKVGLRTGVFKNVKKDTSGPKKTFVRFKVDRDKLMRSQLERCGDDAIDAFWSELVKRSR